MKQAGIVLVIRRSLEEGLQVLVVTNRHYGQYSFPGGKVESYDASPRIAARRELREETSLVMTDSDMTFLFKATNTVTGENREIHVFFARAVYGRPKDLEDGTKHAWFSFQKLLDSSTFAPFYRLHFPDGIEHLVSTVM